MNQLTKRVVAGFPIGGRQDSPFHPSLPKTTGHVIVNEPDNPDGPNLLKGLKGVGARAGVFVGKVAPPPLDENFNASRETVERNKKLTNATQGVLRRSGVQILETQDDVFAVRGWPGLSVVVVTNGGAFSAEVALRENVRLERDPTLWVVGAIVWSRSVVGAPASDDAIVKAVEGLVKEFCNDYHKAKAMK